MNRPLPNATVGAALTAALTIVICLSLSAPAVCATAKTGIINVTLSAKKKKRIRNSLVYLERVTGKWPAPRKPVVMDQKNQKFVPFVLPIVVGTTVMFRNSDATGHNVFSPDKEKYDLGVWGKGETRKYTYKQRGVYTQLCRMHPSMIAYIVALQNPFFAVVGRDGKATLRSVPSGTWTLKVWNERLRIKPVQVTVKPGGNATVAARLKK